jgi:hypothetical protein
VVHERTEILEEIAEILDEAETETLEEIVTGETEIEMEEILEVFEGKICSGSEIHSSCSNAPIRTNYRVVVDNLTRNCNWRDIKDLMRYSRLFLQY